MINLDTINRGSHIISYDFFDEMDDYYEEYYEPIDIEEDEIDYE